jgi:hypothetical protein
MQAIAFIGHPHALQFSTLIMKTSFGFFARVVAASAPRQFSGRQRSDHWAEWSLTVAMLLLGNIR